MSHVNRQPKSRRFRASTRDPRMHGVSCRIMAGVDTSGGSRKEGSFDVLLRGYAWRRFVMLVRSGHRFLHSRSAALFWSSPSNEGLDYAA